jgi:hypothetical protein
LRVKEVGNRNTPTSQHARLFILHLGFR